MGLSRVISAFQANFAWVTNVKLVTVTLLSMSLLAVTVMIKLAVAEDLDPTEEPKAICETVNACQELSISLQSQVDELEAKGIENLSDDEFERYGQLTDDLLAVIKSGTKLTEELIIVENQKQAELKEVIAAENKKQEHMRLQQEQEIMELKALLLE